MPVSDSRAAYCLPVLRFTPNRAGRHQHPGEMAWKESQFPVCAIAAVGSHKSHWSLITNQGPVESTVAFAFQKERLFSPHTAQMGAADGGKSFASVLWLEHHSASCPQSQDTNFHFTREERRQRGKLLKTISNDVVKSCPKSIWSLKVSSQERKLKGASELSVVMNSG